jgi:hypothetical protein
VTLLALNPVRFRGDLEILARAGYRVVKLPFEVTARLCGLVYQSGESPLARQPSPEVARKQVAYRKFLRTVLRLLRRFIGVDAILSAAVHYGQDYDWGVAGAEIGIPYLVMHRENLAASKKARQHLSLRMTKYRPFEGSKIAVHNEVMRAIFAASGYVPPEKVSVLGALRMDDWLATSWVTKMRNGPDAPSVAFFSFGPAAGIFGAPRPQWPANEQDYLHHFCKQTHHTILEFAIENPDVRVTVKPKWAGDWLEKLDEMWRDYGCEELPPNLCIRAGIDAQSLISTSDVVVAFNSTVLLEAGIIGKPVILPLFAEAASRHWRDHIMFYRDRHAFEVATSPKQLKLLLKRLVGSTPSVDQMERRRTLFKRYVGSLEGGALSRYREWLDESIFESRGQARPTR